MSDFFYQHCVTTNRCLPTVNFCHVNPTTLCSSITSQCSIKMTLNYLGILWGVVAWGFYWLNFVSFAHPKQQTKTKRKAPQFSGFVQSFDAHLGADKVTSHHIRLPSIGFRSWSWSFAVSLQVTWVINPAVGYYYIPPDPQLPSQPLRGLLPVLLLGEQSHAGCEQFI